MFKKNNILHSKAYKIIKICIIEHELHSCIRITTFYHNINIPNYIKVLLFLKKPIYILYNVQHIMFNIQHIMYNRVDYFFLELTDSLSI